MNSRAKKIGAVVTAGLLTVTLTAPTQAMNEIVKPGADTTVENVIRVSSVKGNALQPGERSFLMIGPYGGEYTVKSDAPEIVDAEQVMGFWVAVAKVDGKAMITVTNKTGDSGSIEITVGTGKATPAAENTAGRDTTLDANLEIRQEMIRLINQARAENGVAELPVEQSIMDAAQDVSATRPTGHSLYEFESLESHGWMHGASVNLTRFNGQENLQHIAEHAIENWLGSHYHKLTLLDKDVTCLGTGVTVHNGMAYAVMIVGDPNSISPIG